MNTIRYIFKPCLFVGLVIGILMCASSVFCQKKAKPLEVVDQTYKRYFSFNCDGYSNYILVGQNSKEDEFTFYIDESNSADPKKGIMFKIKPLDPVEFENGFVAAFEELIKKNPIKKDCLDKLNKKDELKRKAQSLFYEVVKSVLKPDDDKPVAASILVHPVVPILKPEGIGLKGEGHRKFSKLSNSDKAQVGRCRQVEEVRAQSLMAGEISSSAMIAEIQENPIFFYIGTKEETQDKARIAQSKFKIAESRVSEAKWQLKTVEFEVGEVQNMLNRRKSEKEIAEHNSAKKELERLKAKEEVRLAMQDSLSIKSQLQDLKNKLTRETDSAKIAQIRDSVKLIEGKLENSISSLQGKREKEKKVELDVADAKIDLGKAEVAYDLAKEKMESANARLKDAEGNLTLKENEAVEKKKDAERALEDALSQYLETDSKGKRRKADKALTGSISMMKVDSVQVEFSDGYIEEISVIGKFQDRLFEFTSGIPIGISTARNIDKLDKYWLYEDNYDEYVLKLSDVLKYTKKIYLDGRDYSPQNGTVVIVNPTNTPVKVHKESSKNLLEAKVFSDFVGVGEENPNGLIQTEISKRIPLWTIRWSSASDPRKRNHGLFQYIQPFANLSKVENKNRRITPPSINSVVNGAIDRELYSSSLNILRHENFRAGTSVNLFLCDIPPAKLHFTINGELAFGRTAFRDSTVSVASNGEIVQDKGIRDFGVNTIDLTPMTHLNLLWKPDHRYSFSASYRFHMFLVPDNRITTVANESTFLEASQVGHPLLLNQIQFLVEVRPKGIEFGKFFGRYRFNSQVGNFNTNFHQAQLGYSFFIFQR